MTRNNRLKRMDKMSDVITTKRLIAQSLKELSAEKPFDKISVGDIAARSNVNRQTFYYHFQDKYDLLKWIYREDYFIPHMTDLSMDNWDECLAEFLATIREEKVFCVNTIKHTQQEMEELFLRDTESVFHAAIEYLRQQSRANEQTLQSVNMEERRFIARFFAYGVCGMLIEWIENGMKEEPKVIATRMRGILEICKQLAYKQMLTEQGEDPDKNV